MSVFLFAVALTSVVCVIILSVVLVDLYLTIKRYKFATWDDSDYYSESEKREMAEAHRSQCSDYFTVGGWLGVVILVAICTTTTWVNHAAEDDARREITRKEQQEKNKKTEAEWIANQCPAYDGECGKHGYACEIPVKKLGRNILENGTIVKAHPTC